MTEQVRRAPSLLRVVVAALALLASACWDDGYSDPQPGPPAPAFVWIDDPPAKVDTPSATLDGEAECPGCLASDWQYGACPAIECPSSAGMEVSWTNATTGATGSATHGIVPACHCPWPWGYGYCYTACNHVWWATVPLAFGDNDIVVAATAPGFAQGTEAILVQRVPLAPAWLPAQPGAGEVTLDWTAVDGATSYNLYWSTIPYGWSSLCTKIAGVTAPYTHTGLPSGVTVYYYLTALAGEAESFDSLRLETAPL